MLPTGTSVADRNLVIRALDVARNGDAWKATLKTNVWSNNWLPGDAFQNFIVQEEAKLKSIFTELGL